jgi:hypothetical protein
VEGVWSQTPWTYGPSPGNGGGLWWHPSLSHVRGGCQNIFPLMSGQGEHRLWCWWKSVAGPKHKTWMILFSQWSICFLTWFWFDCLLTVSSSIPYNWSNIQYCSTNRPSFAYAKYIYCSFAFLLYVCLQYAFWQVLSHVEIENNIFFAFVFLSCLSTHQQYAV